MLFADNLPENLPIRGFVSESLPLTREFSHVYREGQVEFPKGDHCFHEGRASRPQQLIHPPGIAFLDRVLKIAVALLHRGCQPMEAHACDCTPESVPRIRNSALQDRAY